MYPGCLFNHKYTSPDGGFGAPPDDVWIHFRFAEKFCARSCINIIPCEPTPRYNFTVWVCIKRSIFILLKPDTLCALCKLCFPFGFNTLYRVCIRPGFDGNVFTFHYISNHIKNMHYLYQIISKFTLLCILIFKILKRN